MSDVVTCERLRSVVIARCHGPLDLAARDSLRAGLPPVTGPDLHAVVVDLEDVPFMDCSAVGVLVVFARDYSRAGTRLLFAAARPVVRRLFTALELGQVFVVTPTADDAVALAESWADLAGPVVPGDLRRKHPHRPGIPVRQADARPGSEP